MYVRKPLIIPPNPLTVSFFAGTNNGNSNPFALRGKGGSLYEAHELVCSVVALLTMLMATGAAPALADDIDRDCFPFCDNGHNNHDGDDDVDVDVEGPFLIDDEVCVFVATEEEEGGRERRRGRERR